MVVLCLLLAVACLYDYLEARIPNWLIVMISLFGLGYRYWDAGGIVGAVGFLEGSFIMLLCFYPLFKIGTIGAGDVKLFASVAGYLSGQTRVCFLFVSLLIAALISIVFILREKSAGERLRYLCAYMQDVRCQGKWELYEYGRGEAGPGGDRENRGEAGSGGNREARGENGPGGDREAGRKGAKGVRLAGPVLLSVIMHMGGIY